MTHFLAMICCAAAIGVVFGIVGRSSVRGRLLYGLKIFAEFIMVGLVLGWLLYFLPLS